MGAQLNTRSDAAAARIAAGLFPHQVEGVAFLLRRRRAILADDMGLGKTRTGHKPMGWRWTAAGTLCAAVRGSGTGGSAAMPGR
jgi:hypothetical protein